MKLFLSVIFFSCVSMANSVTFMYENESKEFKDPCVKYVDEDDNITFYGKCTTTQYTMLNTYNIWVNNIDPRDMF